MASVNIGFMVIGLLYGGDDFGKTIRRAVNGGDDTAENEESPFEIWLPAMP